MSGKRRTLSASGALALLCLLLCLPASSLARIGTPSLALLVRTSHVIVLAEVGKVSGEGEARQARARVLEVWKGEPGGEVLFRASRSWACDTSTAVEGETVVLFLTESPGKPVMSITYHGRGRLPVTNTGGRASVFAAMPAGEETRTGAATRQDWIGAVEVGALRERVSRLMAGGARVAE